MGTELASFATGFFNSMSDDMEVRRAEARDYFNKQVDIARTTGLQNRSRIRGAVDESVTAARKLEALGVPHDIILAQANMDPAGLNSFYDQVVKLSANANVPINEQFFRDNYSLSQEIAAPNEDFATFFSRMYDPIITAAQTDPQGLKDNPKGTIWANAFGFNQMDKARDKLATTMVAPGLTAEQAIQYGDNLVPNHPLGDVTVTPNIDNMKATSTRQEPSIEELNSADKTFESLEGIVGGDPAFAEVDEDGHKAEIIRRIVELYGNNPAIMQHLQTKYGFTIPDTPAEAVGSPPDPALAEKHRLAVEPPTAPVEAPVAPVGTQSTEPVPDDIKALAESFGVTIDKVNPDGSIVATKDGKTGTFLRKDLMDWLLQNNSYTPAPTP